MDLLLLSYMEHRDRAAADLHRLGPDVVIGDVVALEDGRARNVAGHSPHV